MALLKKGSPEPTSGPIGFKALAGVLTQRNLDQGMTHEQAHVDTQTLYGWAKQDMPHSEADGRKVADPDEVTAWLATRPSRRSSPESLRRGLQTVVASIARTERLMDKLPAQRDKKARYEAQLRDCGVPEAEWLEPISK